jgi:hypothetical protein
MKKTKKIYDIILGVLLVFMLVHFLCRTFYTPVHENSKNWGYLPKDATNICYSGDPFTNYLECKMSLNSFLEFAEKNGYMPLHKIGDKPMKIGRYKINQHSTQQKDENIVLPDETKIYDSQYHIAKNGYYYMVIYENDEGHKYLKKYILYDLDNGTYYEERYKTTQKL